MALVIGFFWFGAWFFVSDASINTYDWGQRQVFNVTQALGFELENIYVSGRNFTSAEVLKKAIDIEKGDSLLSFDSNRAKNKIIKHRWVEDVNIKRVLPNTIAINITERTPMALWQKDNKLQLIDRNGIIITDQNLNRFSDLIILTGEGAPQRASSLFNDFKAVPDLFYQIETAVYVSNRRWDIILKNKTIVKLPEENITLALSSLEKLHSQDKILNKPLDFIDLRNLKRITVKTKPGDVQKYNTGYSAYPQGGDRI